MGREKRKSKTLDVPSSRRRRCEEDHVEEWRHWASLPQDMVRVIVSKLPQIDILGSAGLVFPPWRRLALEEPLLWRGIDIGYSPHWQERPQAGWKAMALAALDGSAGRCESFRGHIDEDFLVHLAQRHRAFAEEPPCHRLPFIPDGELVTKIIKKLPLLESVVLLGGEFQRELLLALLDHCPSLELLDARESRPMFRIWTEPIATRIKSRSNIKDFRRPRFELF